MCVVTRARKKFINMCLTPLVYDRRRRQILGYYDRANFSDKFWRDMQLRETGWIDSFMLVACGKCLECLQAKAKEWGFRCLDELQTHNGKGSFITLTYDSAYLKSQNLVKKDLQDFMKRLRRHLEPDKVRYFACGEYGSLRGRPHFHIVLFGKNFESERERFFWRSDHWVYKCDYLSEIWKKGFVSVEDVTLRDCIYVCKYLQKLNPLPSGVTVRPFNLMSRKPAIGCRLLSVDALDEDKLYANGRYIHLPRSYLNAYERHGFDLSDLKQRRELNALVSSDTQDQLIFRREAFRQRVDRFVPKPD